MSFCLHYAQPPSVNTHLTNRVQLPLSQSWNHNGPGVSQLSEPGAVQQAAQLSSPSLHVGLGIRFTAREALALWMEETELAFLSACPDRV